jgi:hypothetical protein
MRRLMHRLAHLFGWYSGDVATWWESRRHGDDKALMVGYRCRVCGDIEGVHEMPRWFWDSRATRWK